MMLFTLYHYIILYLFFSTGRSQERRPPPGQGVRQGCLLLCASLTQSCIILFLIYSLYSLQFQIDCATPQDVYENESSYFFKDCSLPPRLYTVLKLYIQFYIYKLAGRVREREQLLLQGLLGPDHGRHRLLAGARSAPDYAAA